MGLFDRLFGRIRDASAPRSWPTRVDPRWDSIPMGTSVTGGASTGASPGRDADAQALERYQYLVRTAPPQVMEQVHREAFSRLTPEQRRKALSELNASMPPGERLTRDDPAALARLATRAELMRPGTVVSAFGGPGFGGIGMGGLLAGGLLTSFVGSAMGSMLTHQWMDGFHGGHGFDHGFQDGYGDGYGDGFEAGQDSTGDAAEAGGWDGADSGDVTTADWDGGGDDFGGGDDWGGGFDDNIL
jgi:hypothetical protein